MPHPWISPYANLTPSLLESQTHLSVCSPIPITYCSCSSSLISSSNNYNNGKWELHNPIITCTWCHRLHHRIHPTMLLVFFPLNSLLINESIGLLICCIQSFYIVKRKTLTNKKQIISFIVLAAVSCMYLTNS